MIKIYNQDLQLVARIDEILSMQFTHRFYDCGGFEIHLPLSIKNAEKLKIYNVINYNDNWGFILKPNKK